MNYQTFTPPATLAPFIKYFWALESNAVDDSEKTFSAIPDGCPGVIMVQSEKEAFIMDNDKKLPNIFLYGQTVTPMSFSSAGRFGAIGICFQPHALKSIFGLDAGELTNSCTDLTQLGKKNKTDLPEHLSNAATVDDNNYADQSHFIRVFKEFTGFSPFDYRRQSSEVAENFPQIKPT
ncbi:MAG TPA: DUF6597 domain-containing transcriptional factor [Puia sp.]|nr:DUF6597 domain-containing transcriptional factor [Puia sp.]